MLLSGFKMNLSKYLVPICWVLWGILFLAWSWTFAWALFEDDHSPQVSWGFGVVVAGLLLVILAGLALWLFWATRHRSSRALIALTLLLGYPTVVLIGSPLIRAWNTWRFERELSRVGDFPDPASRALAQSIRSGDLEGLLRLLGDGPLPTAQDRAGNGLLAYAAVIVRDEDGNPETVRLLLEAGADPRGSFTPDGDTLLHFMVLDRSPPSIEVVRLLLEHGADPNARDPQSGMTPMANAGAQPELVRLLAEAGANIDQLLPGGESMLVRFIELQQWDSAVYLIQRGAKLDVTNPDGLSVDYFLKQFEDNVYGEHPEGWDRVREAIQARRR